VEIFVHINGTNPALAIWIMIRLASSVSGITDPTIRCAVTIPERIVYLISELDSSFT
jgi:hypothetical protein